MREGVIAFDRKGKSMTKNERNLKLDILRIISAIGVILLHVSSEYIDISAVGGTDFNIAVFINSLTRFAVPVFVMISGELFLNPDKEISTKKIWVHNILRIFILYIIWSYGYYVFQSLYFWKFDFYRHGIVRTLTGIVYATNHLWFLWMIMGLYVLTPVLRSWIKHAEEKNIRYFIIIFFIFQILRNTLAILIGKSLTDEISNLMKIAELTGYLGYFVCGYYFSRYKIKKSFTNMVFASVPFAIAINFASSLLMSEKTGYYNPGIYDSFGVFTFILSIALFIGVGKLTEKSKKNVFLSNLSKDTLGVYLSHIMILEVLKNELGLEFFGNNLLGMAAFTIITAVITFVISAALRRIPKVGRYLA